jgi:hypothetical protein
MAWTNYRNVVRRFGHVDAEFVRSTCLSSSTNLSGFSLPGEVAKRCERHEPGSGRLPVALIAGSTPATIADSAIRPAEPPPDSLTRLFGRATRRRGMR